MWRFFPETLAAIQRRASCCNCCIFPHLQCWSALFADCKGGFCRSISVFWCGTVLKLGFGHHRLPYEQCLRSTCVCECHCWLDWTDILLNYSLILMSALFRCLLTKVRLSLCESFQWNFDTSQISMHLYCSLNCTGIVQWYLHRCRCLLCVLPFYKVWNGSFSFSGWNLWVRCTKIFPLMYCSYYQCQMASEINYICQNLTGVSAVF